MIRRRTALAGLAASTAVAALPLPAWSWRAGETHGMTIVCVIRYQIDPYQREHFQTYAANWGSVIPRCGGQLIGYFLPFEGTNDVGWGLIAFKTLAAYEAYKARLKDDAGAQANFAFAQRERFILREERNFVSLVPGTAAWAPAQ